MRKTAAVRKAERISRAEYTLRRRAQEHAAAVERQNELLLSAPTAEEIAALKPTTLDTLAALDAAAMRYGELVPLKKRRRRRAR